jgi:hypothetical protein
LRCIRQWLASLRRGNAAAKAKIEEEQAAHRAEGFKRNENAAPAIKDFEAEVGGALSTLDKASRQTNEFLTRMRAA